MVEFGNIIALERVAVGSRRETTLGRIMVITAFILVGSATLFLLVRGFVSETSHAAVARQPSLMLMRAQPTLDNVTLYPVMPYAQPAPRRRGPSAPIEHRGPVLAIVIDDIGHSLSSARDFLDLGLALTFAILPGRPYSRVTANLIAQERRDFVIHLPMEPLGYPQVDPGRLPLLLAQDEGATVRRMWEIISSMPGAIGASNHMGSAYTADLDKMTLVQSLLAERNLLFLNSRTAASNVPRTVARKGQYEFLERDIFLDNVREIPAIKKALAKALRVARKRGQAVAIGHPYSQTMQAIKQTFRRGAAGSVKLVSLGELRRAF